MAEVGLSAGFHTRRWKTCASRWVTQHPRVSAWNAFAPDIIGPPSAAPEGGVRCRSDGHINRDYASTERVEASGALRSATPTVIAARARSDRCNERLAAISSRVRRSYPMNPKRRLMLNALRS